MTAFKNLSGDRAVEDILADVPFFCVGILSFGVFTFVLLMKRLDSVLFCLHMSAVGAFISSILDLIQILIRGAAAVNEGLDITPVSGVIDISNVGFALSFGLRFLFFWGFVAQPTPGEVRPLGKAHHNGSWSRWGLLGVVLEIFTLALTLADPVLQILYRTIAALHRPGPLYEVEAAIQVVLSIIFILKLLLNCWVRMLANVDAIPTGMTFVRYSPAIVALLLSAVIGIGNILRFEFTETILGRFLQAIELYILIVYTLVAPFYHLRGRSWSSLSGMGTVPSNDFTPQPSARFWDRTMKITAPAILSPDLFSVVGRNLSDNMHASLVGQVSRNSQISSWLTAHRLSERTTMRVAPASPGSDASHFWYQEQMERGISPNDRKQRSSLHDSAISLTPRSFCQSPASSQRISWEDPALTLTTNSVADPARSPPAPNNIIQQYPSQQLVPNLDAESVRRSSNLPKLTIPPRAYPVSRQDALDMPYPPSAHLVYESQPSAVISHLSGVEDIVLPITNDEDSLLEAQSPDQNFRRRSSRISELIRQQAELDKSIAMLRLFSVDDSNANKSSEQEDRTSRSQSDLSLSNFPEPPWGRASIGSIMTIRNPPMSDRDPKSVNAEGDLTYRGEPPPIVLTPSAVLETAPNDYTQRDSSISHLVEESILTSRSRINSAGTQYEITSFIGGLSYEKNNEPSSFSSLSIIDVVDDGLLHPSRTPRGSSDIPDRSQAPEATASNRGSLPRRTFAAAGGRFSRPVGLPPRPRLMATDVLSPVAEG